MEEEVGPGADMEALVRRLRLHRPAPSSYEPSAAVAPAPGAGELFRPRRAAVLVCLFRGAAGELRVILTKRSSSLSTHSGEVALPGGKAEEGDANDAATALRESKEEIGLDPALVTVVTSLEHFLSKRLPVSLPSSAVLMTYICGPGALKIHHYKYRSACLWQHLLVVVPIIGILSDINAFKPVLNAAEVDKFFDVPLEMFLKDENRTSNDLEWMGQEFTIHHFSYAKGDEKYMIWGLTAGILIHAASVVYQRPPDFAEKRAQFNLPKYSKECRSMPRQEPEH